MTKRLCHKLKLSHLLRYVSILVQTKKHFAFSLKSCELFNRAMPCIAAKRVIVVKTFIKQKAEADGDVTMDGADDLPDFTDDNAEQPDQAAKEEEEWCMATWDEVEEDLEGYN